jgi:hypothetical protein
MTMTTGIVRVDDATQTGAAIAGFLAGYCGSTRRSYATDVRLFAAWCGGANVPLFGVRRAHPELFGRGMEDNGKMRSPVARCWGCRLSSGAPTGALIDCVSVCGSSRIQP